MIEEGQAEEDAKTEAMRERPAYSAPALSGAAHFTATFEDEHELAATWVKSSAKKEGVDEGIAKYDGVWAVEEAEDMAQIGNKALTLKSRAKHHAIAAALSRPFEFAGAPLIAQYEVRFTQGQECGGAYIKLLTATPELDLAKFKDNTPYTIMFGPDRCGNDNKLHFIMRHRNPLTGEFEEKHAAKPSGPIDTFFTDKKTHLFTLVVKPDQSYEVLVDQSVVMQGSLLSNMDPPVNPPKEIVDPEDKKPADWDEREKIPDPEASKPEDWDESEPEHVVDAAAEMPAGWLADEPELVADPEASKPEDWDEDMDGEWKAPLVNTPACESAPGCGLWSAPKIKNPKYVGPWKAPMIANPAYKGIWSARMIPNPGYFEDLNPYKMAPIGALGLELWSMSDGIMFDNFIITDERAAADAWAKDTWMITRDSEKAAGASVVDSVLDATKEKPWLWLVIAAVVALPIVLLLCWCCTGNKVDNEAEAAALRKKTDEPTADDGVIQGDAGDAANTLDSSGEVGEEEGAEQPDEAPNGEAAAAGDAPPPAGDQFTEDEEDGTQEEDEEEEEEPRRSPRKRVKVPKE